MDADPETELHVPDDRQQDLYFNELFQLKVQAVYIRKYRDILARRVRIFAILRAFSSSGGIAAWVVWKELAFLWSGIIAASQLADAMRDVFPFVAQQKSANALLADLDALFIDTLLEWEAIYSGRVLSHDIAERRIRLMKSQHDFDQKHFPTGNHPERDDLLALAEQDATDYLQSRFGDRSGE
jgi:hypothetical protein